MRATSYVRGGKRLFELMEDYPMASGIVLLLIGIGLSLYYFGYVFPTQFAIFGSEGQEAPATVETMSQGSSRSDIGYYADVTFQDASGRPHLVHGTYGFQKWNALKEDRNPTVRYLKKDPSVAVEMHSREGERPNLFWSLLGCGLCLFLGSVLIFTGYSGSREEREAQAVTETPYTPTHRPPPPGRPLA